jgi:predicted phage gp36 major capsid-like protein
MSVAKMNDLDIEEHRVLSKASAGAGSNLVPTSFRNEIINILRFTGPFNQLAEEIVTDSGETLQVPSVSAHGVATWTAENAGYTASDETFGQISLNAFKAGRAVIVSEELLTDAAFDLEAYLAQELGTSIGVLEETAFAVGDGSGKPLGIATAGNGITVSQAAVGNSTSFTYSALVGFIFALAVPVPPKRGLGHGRHGREELLHDGRHAEPAALGTSTSPRGSRTPSWATRSTPRRISRRWACRPSPGSSETSDRPTSSAASTGFALQRQNELYSNNGQVGFRGTERVDGRVRNAAAAIVLQHSAT